MDTVKEYSYQTLKWRNWEGGSAGQWWMEVENQECQGPLLAVVPLMMKSHCSFLTVL
jgi:hypothetical protein